MTSTIDSPAERRPTGTSPVRASPVRVTARLDDPLSRGLWLVKWLLVVPHLIVLAFLWVAFGVLTVVAFVAILVTGRYPRSIFEFNLGVLRWSWRVALLQLRRAGHRPVPAVHPRRGPRLSRPPSTSPTPSTSPAGLVLVKWLLALPHYVIIAFFVGGGSYAACSRGYHTARWTSGGLIGLLVLIAGIALLFTGRYPRGRVRPAARA